MKTLLQRKGRVISLVVMTALIIAMMAPLSAWAAPEDYQIQVEYSATQAGDIDVPATLSFGGYDYKLVTQTAPAIGSTLPVNRTYNYRIAGDVNEEGLAGIKAMLPQANLSFTTYAYNSIQGDIVKKVDGLMINDASLLPGDFVDGGVSYALKTIDWTKDAAGDRVTEVPRASWTASATYEGYTVATAYTLADVTYTSEGALADAYVVIATYEPVTPVVEPTTPTGEPAAVAPVPVTPVTPVAPPDETPVVDVTPDPTPLTPGPENPSDGAENPTTDVADTTTPLAPGADQASSSWIADNYGWLIGAALLLTLIIVTIIIVASRRKKAHQE